ncbi:hypothetical protein C7459_10765 [Tumebacillus permanentifrigoris]|uniref:Uncharacterized protein n=1 Tax=Tumebacillus permanentifrigoris TaxID=378543 RepID=A0A316DD61_9BACL|nr:hypothetical protein C7459_10765 [Tumebacillus permanentifrigoris]
MCLLCIVSLMGCGFTTEGKKYPYGKDTVVQFGDGFYDIGRTATSRVLFQHSQVGGLVIDKNVTAYKETQEKGYVLGSEGYILIDTKTNTHMIHKDLSEFDPADQDVFRVLEKQPTK